MNFLRTLLQVLDEIMILNELQPLGFLGRKLRDASQLGSLAEGFRVFLRRFFDRSERIDIVLIQRLRLVAEESVRLCHADLEFQISINSFILQHFVLLYQSSEVAVCVRVC